MVSWPESGSCSIGGNHLRQVSGVKLRCRKQMLTWVCWEICDLMWLFPHPCTNDEGWTRGDWHELAFCCSSLQTMGGYTGETNLYSRGLNPISLLTISIQKANHVKQIYLVIRTGNSTRSVCDWWTVCVESTTQHFSSKRDNTWSPTSQLITNNI